MGWSPNKKKKIDIRLFYSIIPTLLNKRLNLTIKNSAKRFD